MTIDATAGPSGAAPARLHKDWHDERSYLIDCTPLLRQHELLVRVEVASASGALVLGVADVAPGAQHLRVHLSAGTRPAGGRPFAEDRVHLVVRTTQGVITVPLAVRVCA